VTFDVQPAPPYQEISPMMNTHTIKAQEVNSDVDVLKGMTGWI
jgi:hypothetical protein